MERKSCHSFRGRSRCKRDSSTNLQKPFGATRLAVRFVPSVANVSSAVHSLALEFLARSTAGGTEQPNSRRREMETPTANTDGVTILWIVMLTSTTRSANVSMGDGEQWCRREKKQRQAKSMN